MYNLNSVLGENPIDTKGQITKNKYQHSIIWSVHDTFGSWAWILAYTS